MHRDLTFTSLIGQTFAEITENIRLVMIFIAIAVPIAALSLYLGGATGFAEGYTLGQSWQGSDGGAVGLFATIFAFVASIVLSYWLYSALTRRSQTVDFARFWPWLGIWVLLTLGIVFGFILLIVPGLILLVRWAMVLPLVIEGRMPAMDTLTESWERTSGYGWPIFGVLVVLFILVSVAGSVVQGIAGVLGGASSILGSVLAAAASEASNTLFVACAVAVYRLLRNQQEALTEVFE